jgi:DNA invertase Pin-like site-specific DNA recombinase
MADVEAGKVDCVIVHRVDRLSRSLLDFARLIGAFDKHGVSFVSVTQQFNTSHSLGRLTLNILFSFAQFERASSPPSGRATRYGRLNGKANRSAGILRSATMSPQAAASWSSTRTRQRR